MNVVEKLGILRAVRADPVTYVAAWKARKEFIGDEPSHLRMFDKYPDYPTSKTRSVADFCVAVNSQLSIYRQKKGMFARDWVFQEAEKEPAYM